MGLKYHIKEKMEEEGITGYYLTNSKKNPQKIGKATFEKIQNNKPINTITIEKLCAILECQPGDLMEYIPEEGK